MNLVRSFNLVPKKAKADLMNIKLLVLATRAYYVKGMGEIFY